MTKLTHFHVTYPIPQHGSTPPWELFANLNFAGTMAIIKWNPVMICITHSTQYQYDKKYRIKLMKLNTKLFRTVKIEGEKQHKYCTNYTIPSLKLTKNLTLGVTGWKIRVGWSGFVTHWNIHYYSIINPNLPNPMNFIPFGMMRYSSFDINLMSITCI